MTLVVEDGTVVTMDDRRRIIRDGAVAVEGDRVVAVGKKNEVRRSYRPEIVVRAKGGLILPGLVDCHVHLTQMLARGLADDIDLVGWIHERILPYEEAMTDEDVYASSLLCCLEMIKTGTTTFADPGSYHMEHAARAVQEIGMRGVIAWASMDISDPRRPIPKALRTSTAEALKRTEALFKKCHGAADGRVRVWGALRVEPNVSADLIKRIDEFARRNNIGVEMHNAVSKEQAQWVKRRTGKWTVEYLDSLGVLGPHWLLIHMGWIRANEVSILKRRGVKVAHVPGASMHGAYASCSKGKFPELIKEGVTVCLGNDSSAANNSLDMFRTMWLAATCHKEARYDPTLISPEQALEMATVNGAKTLSWDGVGSIRVGGKADIITINTRRSNWVPNHDFSLIPNLVYSGDGHDVENSIIDGRTVMQDRKVLTVNEDDILARAQRAAEGIVGRVGYKLRPRWPIS